MVDTKRITEQTAKQLIQNHATWISWSKEWALRDTSLWKCLLFAFEEKAEDIIQAAIGTAKPSPFPPGVLLGLGLDVLALGPGYISNNKNINADSLLNIVGGFLRYGDKYQQEHARSLYSQIQEALKDNTPWTPKLKSYSATDYYTHDAWWSPINPADFGLPPLHIPNGEHRFHISLLGWFDQHTAHAVLSKANEGWHDGLSPAALLNGYLGNRFDSAVRHAAEKLIRNYRKAHPEYSDLAKWLQLVSPDFFQAWMSRTSGVKQALAVVRPDAPDDLFTKGVRVLAAHRNVRDALGPWVAKPLHYSMVARLGIDNFVSVLYELPWSVVEPVVTNSRDKVINRLVEIASRPDLIEKSRDLFVDHPKRHKRIQWSLDAARHRMPEEVFRWDEAMKERVRHHREARRYRQEMLSRPEIDRYRLFLITDYIANENGDIKPAHIDVLREVCSEPVIQEALDAAPEHLSLYLS